MRRDVVKIGLFLSTIVIISSFTSSLASARDLWNIISDPLAVNSASSDLSATLERTLNQLSVLEANGDKDVQARLEQIRSIVKEALSGVDASVKNAVDEAKALEQEVDARAIDLIYRAQCTGVNFDQEILQTVANLSDELTKANVRATVVGIPIAKLKANPIILQKPSEVFGDMEKNTLDNLDTTVTPDTPAKEIFWAYQELERYAKRLECLYVDTAGAIPFAQKASEYDRLSKPWIDVVHIKAL